MASRRCSCSCALLFVLIIFSEVVCIQGRHLKHNLCKKCSKNLRESHVAKRAKSVAIGTSTGVGYVQDFRPTAPGHSPGVGHSLNN
ncbi:precursor of CEP6-like [Impatiens glandulifera]|uniref:precursor of CEP6-like n=1 Tax=Impatiens glandulifera TaxID=253017 RepID=UPI001FB06996|nr:precursor of CEP6-like [Impatiens glandulifera]